MKPTFHHKPVNGPFEDPCLYVRLLREKRALMFDAGTIGRLSLGDILKITDIFITHTHIDHFIGFDTILRGLLRRPQHLNVFGPTNIIECIEGKLKGYTWNLIEEYPLRLEVFSIDGDVMRHSSFYAERRFERLDREDKPFSGIVLQDASFKVKAVSLRHDIQCLGFSLEEDFHINIDKAALLDMGLPVGPWLSELKRAIRENAPEDKEFVVSGKTYTFKELRGIAKITKGQKISYVMDVAPDDENIKKILELIQDSDTFYCEAYFLDADRERAVERNHLTAKLVGKIAREGGVKNLVPMHFSPKYRNSPVSPEEEAMEEFLKGI
jgi:ribonuclease Z